MKSKGKIRVELDEIVFKEKSFGERGLPYSPLYAKMQAIIKDLLDKDASDKISDQNGINYHMDSQWNNAISAFSC